MSFILPLRRGKKKIPCGPHIFLSVEFTEKIYTWRLGLFYFVFKIGVLLIRAHMRTCVIKLSQQR